MKDENIKLLDYIKSTAIFLSSKEGVGDFSVECTRLCGWLKTLDAQFKKSSGIDQGERLFMVYNRQVSMIGTDCLAVPEKFKELAACAAGLGFSVLLTIGIISFFREFSQVQALCDEGMLSSLEIVADRLDELAAQTPVEDFIKKLVDLRRPMSIVGHVDELKRHGFLSSPALNAADITFYPKDFAQERYERPAPLTPVRPCSGRMQICVSIDGYIYPCLGLMGFPEQAIGSVVGRDETFDLEGYQPGISALLNHGPEIDAEGPFDCTVELPWMCKRHRGELLKKLQADGSSASMYQNRPDFHS